MLKQCLVLTTRSPEATHRLGACIGRRLQPGGVLALTGALGSGKTVFVQGLARGLGVPSGVYVTSPTYTLVNEYPGRQHLFHLDLYRLADPEELEDLGLADIFADGGVVAIEWAERLPADLLGEHLAVHFESVDADSREIRLTAYGHALADLLKEVENNHKEHP